MIWVVDKQVVRHLIEFGGQMAELPIRVSFEYALDEGSLVGDSLSLKTLYNKNAVCKHFPGIDADELDVEVEVTAQRAIREHLAMSGFCQV